MVARICSLPGVTVKSDLLWTPLAMTWRATLTARPMSSYDELVHDPMRPTLSSTGQPLAFTASLNCRHKNNQENSNTVSAIVQHTRLTVDRGWPRSGVKGPLIWGSSVDRSISRTWS